MGGKKKLKVKILISQESKNQISTSIIFKSFQDARYKRPRVRDFLELSLRKRSLLCGVYKVTLRRTCTGHHGSPERIVFHTVSGVLPYEPRGPSLRLTLFYARRVTCPRSVSYELNTSRNDFTIQFLFSALKNGTRVYFTLCNRSLPLDFALTNISLL